MKSDNNKIHKQKYWYILFIHHGQLVSFVSNVDNLHKEDYMVPHAENNHDSMHRHTYGTVYKTLWGSIRGMAGVLNSAQNLKGVKDFALNLEGGLYFCTKLLGYLYFQKVLFSPF